MATTTSARFLLRRTMAVAAARQSRLLAKPTTIAPFRIAAISTASTPTNQAAPSVKADVVDTHRYENLVEESIKKLMKETNHSEDNEQLRPISNEDLEVRLQYFQKMFEEAELCLKDLRDTLFEVDDEQYLEECSCAEGALNNAFTAYIDLLEDMRRASEEQMVVYSEERNTNACNLKRLRKELDQIIKVANNRDLADT